jgi:carbamoyltransferase
MNKYNTFAVNGSHDCSFTFIDKSNNLRIYEYERFTKKRYSAFTKTQDHVLYGSDDYNRNEFISLLKDRLMNHDIENILYHDLFDVDFEYLSSHFPRAKFTYCNHHESHAYSALHNSGFEESLIFSIDGGGHDYGQISMTNVYIFKNSKLIHIDKPDLDFGTPYRLAAHYIKDIPSPGPGDLSESGKFMGLAAYGRIREEWKNSFRAFYKHNNVNLLAAELNICSSGKCLEGQTAYDYAATSQFIFEELLFKFTKNYVEKYNTNVILTGGCALNVLFNQKMYEYLSEKNLRIYVPSNPNDCGLSYGMWISKFNDFEKKEICFSGIEILDEMDIKMYEDSHNSEELTFSKVVDYLKDGKIIGIINSNSEVGPRALGNRSIICDPSFENMKDVLNRKVKFREWFRPFAPVCRLEDKDIYFDNAPECKYMSFAPKVKESYRSIFPSITHVDGTSRLQTVTEGIFYSILNAMKDKNHLPIILNTSFNIKGRPILTSLKDAFHVLDNTEMDLLIFKNKIYSK